MKLAILLMTFSVSVIACNPNSGSSQTYSKATDFSYQALSGHDPAACPNLRGAYTPQDRIGSQFEFRERGGYLVVSTRAAGQLAFSEVIVVSGVEIVYGNGDTAAAKCVAGQIIMHNTTASGSRVQVSFEATANGFVRVVSRPRNPPVLTHFLQY